MNFEAHSFHKLEGRARAREVPRPFPLCERPYGCCPGGALPAGFVAGFCSRPPPVHTGCCPGGRLPPWFSQDAGVILANATPPNDIVSAIVTAANNNAMRFLIASHLLSFLKDGNWLALLQEVAGSVAGSARSLGCRLLKFPFFKLNCLLLQGHI